MKLLTEEALKESGVIADYNALLAKREAEIERLRGELADMDGARVLNANALRLAKEEIEQLRKELEREKEEHDRCTTFHAIAVKERNHERVLMLQRDAEIERLRKYTDGVRCPACDTTRLELGEARAEIERLRQENEVFKEQLMHWVAEDHKLRGLLREADDALSHMPQPTRKLKELRQRVREALEEKINAS